MMTFKVSRVENEEDHDDVQSEGKQSEHEDDVQSEEEEELESTEAAEDNLDQTKSKTDIPSESVAVPPVEQFGEEAVVLVKPIPAPRRSTRVKKQPKWMQSGNYIYQQSADNPANHMDNIVV